MARGDRPSRARPSRLASTPARPEHPLLGDIAELERQLVSPDPSLGGADGIGHLITQLEMFAGHHVDEAVECLLLMLEQRSPTEAVDLLDGLGHSVEVSAADQMAVLRAYAERRSNTPMLARVEALIAAMNQSPETDAPPESMAMMCGHYLVWAEDAGVEDERFLGACAEVRRQMGAIANAAFTTLVLNPVDPGLLEQEAYRRSLLSLFDRALETAGGGEDHDDERSATLLTLFALPARGLRDAARLLAMAGELKRSYDNGVSLKLLQKMTGEEIGVWACTFPDSLIIEVASVEGLSDGRAEFETMVGADHLVGAREGEWWHLREANGGTGSAKPYRSTPARSGREVLSRVLRLAHDTTLLDADPWVPARGLHAQFNLPVTAHAAADLLCDPHVLDARVYRTFLAEPGYACVDLRIVGADGRNVCLRAFIENWEDVRDELVTRPDKPSPIKDEGGLTQEDVVRVASSAAVDPATTPQRSVPVERLLMHGACQHPVGEWVNDLPGDDRLRLRCADCARERIAVVWRHQLPASHPQAMTGDELGARYNLLQRLRWAAAGKALPDGALARASMVACDGAAVLDPAAYVDENDPLAGLAAPPARATPRRLRA